MPIDLGEYSSSNDGEGDREPIDVDTAFMVIVRDGNVIQCSGDINAPVVPRRDATVEDMEMACHKISADIQAQKTAQITQVQMMQSAAAAQQQAEANNIAQSLKL